MRSKIGSEAEVFLNKLTQKLKRYEIEVMDNWDIDHLCYRSETNEDYGRLKIEFSKLGRLLVESEVNRRLIATYELYEPILFENWQINLVELPAPKQGKATKNGFEHIEVVVDKPLKELEEKYGNLTLDRSGMDKRFNQELEICLGDENIKFHPCSLASVVSLELNKRVWGAISESKVLEALEKYQPLIAGSYPLGLGTENSDVDIVVGPRNMDEFVEQSKHRFSSYENYSVRSKAINNEERIIIRFRFQNVNFEIFAQNTPSIEQIAYKHFLAEERFLKLGGGALRTKVMRFRAEGLKTEAAFAKALGLVGDPYIELLNAQGRSNESINELLKGGLL